MLRVESTDGYDSGMVSTITLPILPSGITTATFAEGEVYVIEGSAVARAFGQEPELPFEIVRLPTR